VDLASYSFPTETLRSLAEASGAINSTLELDTVLKQIAQSAANVMQAEASSVLTYDRHRNKLIFSAAVGTRGAVLIGQEFDADLGIAGHVLQSGEAVNIDDVSKNPDFFKGIDEQSQFETRGLMAAPMIYHEQIVGVIEVLNRIGGGTFEDRDLDLLKVLANLAAGSARNAIAHESLKKENRALRGTVMIGTAIIGSSKPLKEILKLADRVAPTQATVLLTGETGTGKEVLAKYIHNASPRRDKAFVAVNCAALPETLLESELFGHEKGSFTGAMNQHIGWFELADNGTLFLDEIGDISASTQVKLLRLLQEKTFTRVGGTKTITCDVRIIAATNRDLKRAIADGKFRDDLYYRLNVFPINVSTLHDRKHDVPTLAEHFVKLSSVRLGVPVLSISPDTLELMQQYLWPGNIRELANVIERAVLLCDGNQLLPSHLPPEINGVKDQLLQQKSGDLRANERSMIVDALLENHWNQSAAARDLGISRDNLRYRIKKYDIKRE